MHPLKLIFWLATVPALLAAQEGPVDRLRAALPAGVADQIIAIVTDATDRGLPGDAIADRALEAVAKGESGAQARSAAQAMSSRLAAARAALRRAGRTPDASETESAAGAMELGVDGATVSALAASTPPGRSLAVPLAVLGALVNRGLPADGALQAVVNRLTNRASSDADLVEMPGEAGLLIARGYRPNDVGRALGTARPAGLPANEGRAGTRPKRSRVP